MRIQTLKTAAIGVMLFGGTLGASSVANADFMFSELSIHLEVNGDSFQATDVVTGIAGGMASSNGTSLTLSPFTSTGFTLTASGGGDYTVWATSFKFTVDSLTTVSLSGNTAGDSANIFFFDETSNAMLFLRGEGGSGVAWTSGDIVLAAGHSFWLAVNPSIANASSDVGTVLNFAVPAPGAFALIGAAGLVGARRRRA